MNMGHKLSRSARGIIARRSLRVVAGLAALMLATTSAAAGVGHAVSGTPGAPTRTPLANAAAVVMTPRHAQAQAKAQAQAETPGDKATPLRAPHAEIALAPLEFDKNGAPILRLTMRPRAGIHIYAPGQRGYYPLSITFAPGDGLAAGRLELPTPEPYVFVPTGEKFLVFKDAFSLVQHAHPVRAGARGASSAPAPSSPQSSALARVNRPAIVRATLHYQACDEQVCYRPVALPLAWTRDAAATPLPER